MQFWKMNGAGNGFILPDNRSGCLSPQRLSVLARQLCRRNVSIGAAGLPAAAAPVLRGLAAGPPRLPANPRRSVPAVCSGGAVQTLDLTGPAAFVRRGTIPQEALPL